jgi:hypothetical protein
MQKIFETNSPVDRTDGDRPKRPRRAPPEGSIDKLCAQIEPLLRTKKLLDEEVYCHGYFDNHYPEASKKLKDLMHERTMSSWAHAEHFVPGKSHEEDEKKDKNISVVVNVGS